MIREPHTETDDFYRDLEPELEIRSDYREAAMRLLPLIESGIAHCLAAKTPDIGRIQIKYALGLESRPMRQVASSMGITVACISSGARKFVEANDLPLPPCMRSEAASDSYRAARERQLKDPNEQAD
jgi:hypothetical protein